MMQKRMRELKNIYGYIRKVCCYPNQKYEGVHLDPNWQNFDDFVKDNWFRYYRAKVKWRNYKRVSPRGKYQGNLKRNYIRFKRRIKEKGYTKENTFFSSPSDIMKYSSSTHKYMFEDKLLGTRDIKNILKKRGIYISMESIVKRLKKGERLFSPNGDNHTKWRGKYRSFVEIAEMENVSYDLLKKYFYKTLNIKKSIDIARKIKRWIRYDFEGQQLLRSEICKILSQRTGLKYATIYSRFKIHGYNINILTSKKNLRVAS